MFVCYHGQTGSGKTYKAVKDIDDLCKKYIIFHNIDGLKPEYFDFPDRFINFRESYFEKNICSPKEFFTKSFQIELSQQCKDKYSLPICIILDEAHDYFLDQNKDFLIWLAWHRHLGQHIIFITQNTTQLHHTYRKLINFEYRAKLDFWKFFVYQRIDKGETTGLRFERKKASVFKKYKSYETPSKQYFNPFLLFLPILVICGLYLYFRNPVEVSREKRLSKINESALTSGNSGSSKSDSIPGKKIDFSSGPGASFHLPSIDFKNFYYVGCSIFWKNLTGSDFDGLKSRFYLCDESGQTWNYKDIFPNFVYSSHTQYFLKLKDLKTRKIFTYYAPEKKISKPGASDKASGPLAGFADL